MSLMVTIGTTAGGAGLLPGDGNAELFVVEPGVPGAGGCGACVCCCCGVCELAVSGAASLDLFTSRCSTCTSGLLVYVTMQK
jgi:hypothetical protein